MLNLASLKEVASFHEGMSLFADFLFSPKQLLNILKVAELKALFVLKTL